MPDALVDRLFVRHLPRQAELAIVFGFHLPQGAAHRARHAARLFLDGLIPRVLFTGGAPHEPGQEAEAIRMALVAIDAGLPPAAAFVEPCSINTFQNVVFSRDVLARLGLLAGLRRVLLVSCPWHLGRVLRIAKLHFDPRIEFLCCPHDEECTADTWSRCPTCVQRVQHEAEFLELLIRQGALPERA